MSSIRQWQKATSRAARSSYLWIDLPSEWATRVFGWDSPIALRMTACRDKYFGAGITITKGREILAQNTHDSLVKAILRLDNNRGLEQSLALLARKYPCETEVADAMSDLVAEILSRCGGNLAPSDAEDRKKGTDQVDGTTQTGDQTHGGDSASGEVPDGQSDGGEDVSVGGRADICAIAQQELKKELRKQKRSGKSGQGKNAFAEFENLDLALVKRARNLLSTIVSGGNSQFSSRFDHTEVVKRQLAHRPLAHARREEAGRPIILVIADVSGSCDTFAAPACDVAQACGAIGVEGSDIVTVRCTNVWNIHEVRINNRPVSVVDGLSPDQFATWITCKTGNEIEIVIALGDSDEFDTYQAFALRPSVTRVIWLDNYAHTKNEGPVFQDVPQANWRGTKGGKPFVPQAQRKLTYMIGCGDAAAMVKGLALSLRG